MTKNRSGKTRAELKRAQIRKGAYSCFRTTGYHDTSVDAICKQVGISKGSYYWHYESKQDVFIDILEVWAREVMDELYEQFEKTVVTEDYLTAIKSALEQELHRGRALVPLWLEFTVQAKRDREIQEALSKFYRRARIAIAEILRPVMEDRFTESQLKSVAATIFGAYVGLLIQEFSDPDRANAKQAVEGFMEVFGLLLVEDYEARTSKALVLPTKSAEPEKIGARLSQKELQTFLNDKPQWLQDATLALRTRILEIAPALSERVIVGWKVLTFKFGNDILSIKPASEGLKLNFHQGAQLKDPQRLLLGRGKSRRYLVIEDGEAFPDPKALKKLIQEAIDTV